MSPIDRVVKVLQQVPQDKVREFQNLVAGSEDYLSSDLFDFITFSSSFTKSTPQSLKNTLNRLDQVETSDADELEKILKDIVDDVNVDDVADSPEGGPLDKFAFFDDRTDPHINMLKRKGFQELNTDVEDDIFIALHGHIVDNRGIPRKVADEIIKLNRSAAYDSVITPPTSEKIMRGLFFTVKQLRTLVSDRETFKMGDRIRVKAVIKNRYADVSDVVDTSWTTSYAMAHTFGTDAYEDRVGVILYANMSDNDHNNFISGPSGFYKLGLSREFTHEEEVIALGDVIIYEIEVTHEGRQR